MPVFPVVLAVADAELALDALLTHQLVQPDVEVEQEIIVGHGLHLALVAPGRVVVGEAVEQVYHGVVSLLLLVEPVGHVDVILHRFAEHAALDAVGDDAAGLNAAACHEQHGHCCDYGFCGHSSDDFVCAKVIKNLYIGKEQVLKIGILPVYQI